MARPRVVADETILKAAHGVFMRKGTAATTAEIARRAGVAEATIFKRFKTKAELFRAATNSEMASWMLDLMRTHAEEEGDLRAALVKAGLRIIEMARKVVPVLVMSWSSRGEFGPLSAAGRSKPFGPIEELVRFFEAQMRAGRIRAVDPVVLTAGYFGALQDYAFVELLRGQHPLAPEAFVGGFVGLLWNGIAPRAPRRRSR